MINAKNVNYAFFFSLRQLLLAKQNIHLSSCFSFIISCCFQVEFFILSIVYLLSFLSMIIKLLLLYITCKKRRDWKENNNGLRRKGLVYGMLLVCYHLTCHRRPAANRDREEFHFNLNLTSNYYSVGKLCMVR